MESGHTPSRNHPEYWNGDIPWIAVGDAGKFHGGVINDTKEHTNQLGIDNSSARLLPTDTVCLSRGGTVGYVVRLGRPMATSQGFANWICGPKLNPSFLQYLLLSEESALDRFSIGTTIKTIYYPDIKALHVCIPPLPEQQRIVTKLDAAFGALREAEGHVARNRANARELFESYLNGVFERKGDEWVRLDVVCEITSMLVDPRLPEHLDFVHVGGGNIESMTGRLLDLKTARQEELRSGKFLFDKSMVLYNKIRPYLVKVARPTFSGLCSADMYPLSPKAGLLDRDYLYYALISNHFTEYAISGSDRAGMPKVNRDHLFAYEFPLPSMKEQHRIAKALDALLPQTQALEATYQQKLRELEGLKKGLLGAAFRGEL
jgi:type I restriction enzyme S subunit